MLFAYVDHFLCSYAILCHIVARLLAVDTIHMLLSLNLDNDSIYIQLLQVIYLTSFLLSAGCTLDSDNDKWNLLLVYSVILRTGGR